MTDAPPRSSLSPSSAWTLRRRSVRRAVAVPCEVRSDHWEGARAFQASNLSPEGMWLDSPLPLSPGDQLLVSFRLPGELVRMHALCEVRRVGAWEGAGIPWASGFGVAFTHLSSADRRRIAVAVTGRPPPLPLPMRAASARVRGPSGVDLEPVLESTAEACAQDAAWTALTAVLTGGAAAKKPRNQARDDAATLPRFLTLSRRDVGTAASAVVSRAAAAASTLRSGRARRPARGARR